MCFSAPDVNRLRRLICRDVTATTDANLVAAALRGDAESFSRLCEQYYPALVAIAYSQLADRNLAEDAAQEALLVAYCDIAKLKKPERFAGWLTTICRNIAVNMARSQARARHAGVEDCSPVTNACRSGNDTVASVREIILRLKPDLRDIVYLRYYNQMAYGQIAQMLGISEEAVNGRLRRARDAIRREFERQAPKKEIQP